MKDESINDRLTALSDWGKSGHPKVGSEQVSRVHHLAESLARGNLGDAASGWMREAHDVLVFKPMKTFVITTDWTEVMGEDGWQESEIRLPFPHCSFEFVLDNVPVILVCMQKDGESPVVLPCLRAGGMWIACEPEHAKKAPPLLFAWLLVKACCIVLDANVATHEVIRAPCKLNAKREKQGKMPMMDFHVIDLKRRARTDAGFHGEPTRHVRLHFRRGHWRHYDSHKTWINWQLVGDQSLGVVNSRYSA